MNNSRHQFANAYHPGTVERLFALSAINSVAVNLMSPKLFRTEATLNGQPTRGPQVVLGD